MILSIWYHNPSQISIENPYISRGNSRGDRALMMPGVVVPNPALSRAAAENQASQARADNQASQAGANPPAHEWRLQNSEQTHLLHGRTGARGSSVAAHSVRHGMHSPACHSEQSEESVPPSPCLPPSGKALLGRVLSLPPRGKVAPGVSRKPGDG